MEIAKRIHMKTSICILTTAVVSRICIPFIVRPIGLGLLAIVVFAGCATKPPVALVQGGTPNTTIPIRLELGPIGVVSPAAPAQLRFDKADGRIDSATDAAGHAAGLTL